MFTPWCGFFNNQMTGLWRFSFPDVWKLASPMKSIFSKNKLSSSKRFSISVQKSLRRCRTLGCNFFSSWNQYSRKDNRLRNTLHTATWETSPNSLLARLVNFLPTTEKRRMNTLHSLVTWLSDRILPLSTNATSFSKWFVSLVNGFFHRSFLRNHRWTNVAEWFCSNYNSHLAFSTSVKFVIFMDDCSTN
jgi:hypothetical protein